VLTLVIIHKVGRGILIIRDSIIRLFFYPRRDEYSVVVRKEDPVKDDLPVQMVGTKGDA
jgi:hypothetical protein